MAASSQTAATVEWVEQVKSDGLDPLQLAMTCPAGHRSLDAKLSAAILASLKGDSGNRIGTRIDELGILSSGRGILKLCDLDAGVESERHRGFALAELVALNHNGKASDALDSFLQKWDAIMVKLTGCEDESNDNMRCTLLHDKLEKLPRLAADFAAWRRAIPGSPGASAESLLSAIRSQADDARHELSRQRMSHVDKPSAAVVLPPPQLKPPGSPANKTPKTELCRNFAAGRCSKEPGKCKYLHKMPPAGACGRR